MHIFSLCFLQRKECQFPIVFLRYSQTFYILNFVYLNADKLRMLMISFHRQDVVMEERKTSHCLCFIIQFESACRNSHSTDFLTMNLQYTKNLSIYLFKKNMIFMIGTIGIQLIHISRINVFVNIY